MLSTLCTWAWLSAVLPFCPAEPRATVYTGYVEGEYVAPAPVEPGRIVELAVVRGERVAADAVLYRLDDTEARQGLLGARAALAAAQAEFEDLTRGKRPAEIAVTEAQLEEISAQLRQAERDHRRTAQLYEKNVVSQAAFDRSVATLDQARAQAEALRKRIAVETMPAREMAIEAARSRVAAEQSALQRAEWKLEQTAVRAPAPAVVDTVLRRPGEASGPDRPAVQLLPDGNRAVRFFVPEPERARFRPGVRVTLSCDGCAPGLRAVVSHVASEPEFTPPVIYSVESRAKLMFLVEARPAGAAARLAPGQPLDVSLLAEAAR